MDKIQMLWDIVNGVSTVDDVQDAEFIVNSAFDNDEIDAYEWDELMNTLSFLSRDIYRYGPR